jgi:hypothetical protein
VIPLFSRLLLVFAALGLTASAQPLTRGTPPPSRLSAVADVDGDRSPDLVSLTVWFARGAAAPGDLDVSPFRASVPLAGATFQSGLLLHLRDVDADRDVDLVLTSLFSRETLAVWLNDGSGNFARTDAARFPAPSPAPEGLRSGAVPASAPCAVNWLRGPNLESLQSRVAVSRDGAGDLLTPGKPLADGARTIASFDPRGPPER